MVIKTLRWKSRGFNRLVDYIGKEGRDEDETFRLLHNLRPSRNLFGIARQFWAQDAFRKERVNGITIYHEILAFGVGEDVPLDVLEDLTRKYLELRAPNALAYAEPHFDKQHIHVHVAISGTEFESAKTLRLDNKEFMRVRRELERYQQQHYPELEKSIVYLNERKRKRRREDIEQERIAELEAIQKATAERELEPTPDMPEPEAEAAAALELEAEQAEVEAAQAEAEALQQEAELDAAHAEAEALQQEAEDAEIQAAEQEAARIAELEQIQEEARQREQERGLEMD